MVGRLVLGRGKGWFMPQLHRLESQRGEVSSPLLHLLSLSMGLGLGAPCWKLLWCQKWGSA